MHPLELSMRVVPDERSVRLGRRFVGHALLLFGHDDLEPTASLLVSELLGNAVRFADSQIRLSVTAAEGTTGGIRIEVWDDGPGVPMLAEGRTFTDRGRGLQVVDRLADRWDVDHAVETKAVWFELRVPADVGALPSPTR
jgi:anti-sigma regulatory factor (Ser/Thr protein kinase)